MAHCPPETLNDTVLMYPVNIAYIENYMNTSDFLQDHRALVEYNPLLIAVPNTTLQRPVYSLSLIHI